MYGKKIVLTACVSMFLTVLMFLAMTTSASTYTVGVKAGDLAGYGDISFEYASNIPGQEQPPLELNISRMDLKILDVSDSNVTLQSTVIYGNGTEQTYISSGNIATGEGNLSDAIIPSNLGAGDEIPANLTEYTQESLKLTINGTVTRSYAGANREVNYVNITYPIIYGNVAYGTINMSLYWDKKTGVMCEEIVSYAMSYPVDSTHYYMNMSMIFRMTESNMWSAEVAFWMQWWFWTIVAVVIVALAGAVYFLMKRKPPTPTAPTSPT